MRGLPAGWKWAAVDEVAGRIKSNVVIGPFGSSLKVSDYADEGVPLVFVRNIRNKDFAPANTRFVSAQKARELMAHEVRTGDVLIAKMGDPPGDAAVYPAQPPGIVTADCIRLRPGPTVDARFLAYAFDAPVVRGQFQEITRGVAQQKVSLARFRQGVVFPLPPLEEQRRIVDVLEDHFSRLDAGESLLRRAGRALVGLRERLVVDAVCGAEAPGPRHAVGLADAGVDDGQLPELPTGWQWQRLGQLADVVGGVTKDVKKQSDPSFVEVPYLRVANVQRGRLALDLVTNIRVPRSRAEALRLLPGDVLMNEGGDRDKLGRGWVWDGQIEHCIHQNHVFRGRVRDQQIHPKLLSWAANTVGGRWCERNGKQSVNLASISLNKIRLMPIPVPPPEQQEKIVAKIEERLAGCDRLADVISAQLQHAVALRRALLASAFVGALVPQGAHPEAVGV